VGDRLVASPGRPSRLAGGCRSCGRNGGTDLSDPNQVEAGENPQAGIRGVKPLQTKALTSYGTHLNRLASPSERVAPSAGFA
jgi:hypothetical protein